MSGVTAGMIASMITQPADVVKMHMQLDPNKYKKFRQTIVHLYQVLVNYFRTSRKVTTTTHNNSW